MWLVVTTLCTSLEDRIFSSTQVIQTLTVVAPVHTNDVPKSPGKSSGIQVGVRRFLLSPTIQRVVCSKGEKSANRPLRETLTPDNSCHTPIYEETP